MLAATRGSRPSLHGHRWHTTTGGWVEREGLHREDRVRCAPAARCHHARPVRWSTSGREGREQCSEPHGPRRERREHPGSRGARAAEHRERASRDGAISLGGLSERRDGRAPVAQRTGLQTLRDTIRWLETRREEEVDRAGDRFLTPTSGGGWLQPNPIGRARASLVAGRYLFYLGIPIVYTDGDRWRLFRGLVWCRMRGWYSCIK